jgi:cytochrome c biogenesis protein CcmG, thiol:disulfide interchange protein DsbE
MNNAAITRPARRGPTVATILLVVFAAFGLWTAAGCAGTSPAAEATPVTVTGSSLPRFTPGVSDPAIGMAAPRVQGVDFNGNPVTVGDGPALVVFVAHWCPHCQAEVPVLVDWTRTNGALPVVLVSSAEVPTRPNHPASAWLARENWVGPVLVDDPTSTALAADGLDTFPAFVAIDIEGLIVGRTVGPQPAAVFDAISNALVP